MSLMMACTSIAPMLAPLIGGAIAGIAYPFLFGRADLAALEREARTPVAVAPRRGGVRN